MKRQPATNVPRPAPERKQVKSANTQTNAWLAHHLYIFFFSLGQLVRTPLTSLLTAAVIGIALALPTGLYLLLENFHQISQEWGGTVQISLFLKQKVTDAQARSLAGQIHQNFNISVQVISHDEALQEYRALSGFGEALNVLEENPLPAVLVIQPTQTDPPAVQSLLTQLQKLPEVEIAQLDMQWLERLFAIMEVGRRGVLILSSLLGLAVVLIIGNTIRLAIHNRREEIEVHKLFGATDAFIRRPFLYIGFWYGLMGSAIAWFLVSISLWSLAEPVKKLTALYYSQFALVTLDMGSSLILLGSGIFLGLAGAWLAVSRHLKGIQPR
ncbi:MAG: cell division protein FtsX [Beggiatoa sp. IS2]|nr:MAG: cell division protein FtsX [Beggiatoa sp. IS2]